MKMYQLKKWQKASTNLLSVIFIFESMQRESRDLENPSTVHVTVSTGQVTV